MSRGFRWNLLVFFAGIVLGLVLIALVAATNTSAAYAASVAPNKYGQTDALGSLLEVLPLAAFGLTVLGVALLTASPTTASGGHEAKRAGESQPRAMPARAPPPGRPSAAPPHSP